MCEHTYWNEPPRDMSLNQFTKIIDQFPNLKWIGLTGIGESFVNKDFMEMLRYVKDHDIFVELYDNFFYINKQMSQQIVEMEIDRIFISLDAATKETYEKMRPGSNFTTVLEHIGELFRIKREQNKDFPGISFHFIVTADNIKEIPAYIKLIRKLSNGESGIQFSRLLHRYPEIEPMFIEIPDEVIESSEELARENGIRVNWNLDVLSEKPPVQECIEWIMPFIFVTGDVIPCCSGNEANNRDNQRKYSLGNIFEQDFGTIWNGERYRKLRKDIQSGKCRGYCYNCCLYR
jgi:MoaA/NifB/PqqE/SkfB family radical SAM enzyme